LQLQVEREKKLHCNFLALSIVATSTLSPCPKRSTIIWSWNYKLSQVCGYSIRISIRYSEVGIMSSSMWLLYQD
jgi:hypothetical protein